MRIESQNNAKLARASEPSTDDKDDDLSAAGLERVSEYRFNDL